jgi:hypothetical protein
MVVTVVVFAACATGDSNEDMSPGAPDAALKKDTGNQPVPDGSGNTKDTGSMCSSCNIDSDCTNTCGAPPDTMTWCCDMGMNSCYPAQACQDQDSGTGTD